MNILWASASIGGTFAVYWLNKRAYRRWKKVYLSPVVVTPLLLITLLLITHISYTTYMSGGQWLSLLLKPATVAFAVPMYKHFPLLKKHALEIIASVLAGSAIAALSSAWLAYWVHLSPAVATSLIPRSVTTPVAIDISRMIGGITTMTAVFVIITGILGLLIGPYAIRLFSIRTSVGRGVLFGMSSHGIGTTKAFEMGELEGTISSLSMIIAAAASVLLVPWLLPLIHLL